MRRLRALGWKRLALVGIGVVIALFALAQAVPYGRAHTNPPAVAEPRAELVAGIRASLGP